MLRLDGVTKRYGARLVLDGLAFTAAPGRLCGFLGANGAGKTTAMRCIFGMVEADAGSITWRELPVGGAARRRFGYLPEQRGLYPKMRLADQLVYYGRLHGLAAAPAARAAADLLEELGLADRGGERVEVLSHGNQQRVQLAAALVHAPELVVADEPFSGLDPLGVASLERILRRRAEAGVAVVFSSHQLDVVEYLCDDVVLIDNGRVVLAGPLDAIRRARSERVIEVSFQDGSRRRDTVPAGTDVRAAAESAAAEAAATGRRLAGFSFRPPSLAEIFRAEVGR